MKIATGQIKTMPLSLAEVKSWLRLFDDDTSEDDTVNALVASAVDVCESKLNYNVAKVSATQNFADICDVLFVDCLFHSVQSVTYRNELDQIAVMSASDYRIEPLDSFGVNIVITNGSLLFSDVNRADKIVVNLRVGYEDGSVPNFIKTACRLMIADWFDNRADGKKAYPSAVDNILFPHRRSN